MHMQELAQALNTMCDGKPFASHWYLKDLRTGETADRFGDTVVPSASVRKIAIMMTAFKQVHEGKLSLEDPFEIEAKYQGPPQPGGGVEHLWPGFIMPFYNGMVLMMILSDNTCTTKIVDILGLDNVNEFSRSIGMKGTAHRFGAVPLTDDPFEQPVEDTNATTAEDVGLLLELILRGTTDEDVAARLGSTTRYCKMALDILGWQKMVHGLPAQLPQEAGVAHKTGTGLRNANDAGIIFENGEPRFILSVFIDGVPRWKRDGPGGQTAASAHIATLCRTCWDALVSQ